MRRDLRILKELVNVPMFNGQNGWTTEGWRSITNKLNDMFPTAHFTKQQVQEKEKELKGNYKIIKEATKSGVGWNDTLGMIIAESKGWEKLIKDNHKVAKFHKKSFPLYNSLELLYKESTEVQSALASRNSKDQDVTGGKKHKQSQMAAKLGDYIDFRKDQIEKNSRKKHIDIVDAMEGPSDEQKVIANKVFQSETNIKILVGTKNPSV
uniref:Myb/SANT-like domain-containing protein n=1 Tax=Setaria italica TaxID=4555 RepID=K3YZS4_SETIT